MAVLFEEGFGLFGEGVGGCGGELEGELFLVGWVEFGEQLDCGAGGVFEAGDDGEACGCIFWLLIVIFFNGMKDMQDAK